MTLLLLLACPVEGVDSGDTGVPVMPIPVMMSAGHKATCAVLEDATAECWGTEEFGQAPAPEGSFTDLSVAMEHACGIVEDLGVPFCWGENEYGRASPPTTAYERVTTGGYHSCAWTPGADGECWGYDAFERLVLPDGPLAVVAAGRHDTCTLTGDGVTTCEGPRVGNHEVPEGVFLDVDVGEFDACAVREAGGVVCWGEGDLSESAPDSGTFTSVTVGGKHACALTADQLVTCWGDNTHKQGKAPALIFASITAGGGAHLRARHPGRRLVLGARRRGPVQPSVPDPEPVEGARRGGVGGDQVDPEVHRVGDLGEDGLESRLVCRRARVYDSWNGSTTVTLPSLWPC